MKLEREQPVTGIDDLLAYFRSGEKPRSAFRIGLEHEKIGLYRDGRARVPYEGEHGIGALLERIAAVDAWKPVAESGNVIALEKDGASITLEPGGQMELSGAPLATIRETCREFNTHVDLVKGISEEFGIDWLALGVDPLHPVAEIPRMPKARYGIMSRYLPSRGGHALEMMHATATCQANFDFESEADMAATLRMAMGCSPLVSAIFANSAIAAGGDSGYASRRVSVWEDTDPDRCGILPFVFEPGFGYREYAEWALDVPMFFVVRGGRYHEATHMSFRRFIAEGFEGERATLGDWDTHLTTLFPEVRLKRIIEVRGADAVPPRMICALPALWKGVFYDDEAGAAAWELVAGLSLEERVALWGAVARQGLAADSSRGSVLGLAREFAGIAAEGLRRIAERGETDADERHFLEPVQEILGRGRSLGEEAREAWRGDWGGSVERLIEYARY